MYILTVFMPTYQPRCTNGSVEGQTILLLWEEHAIRPSTRRRHTPRIVYRFSGSNLSKGREMLVRPQNSHAQGAYLGLFEAV